MKEPKLVSTYLFVICSILTGIAILCSIAVLGTGWFLHNKASVSENEVVDVMNQIRFLPKEEQIEYLGYMPEQASVAIEQENSEIWAEAELFRDSYCIENSDSVQLNEETLTTEYSYGELYYAYYEIFARHHVIFDDPVVQSYFSGKSWYQGELSQEDFLEDDAIQMNDYEIYNSNLIYNAFLEYERQDIDE